MAIRDLDGTARAAPGMASASPTGIGVAGAADNASCAATKMHLLYLDLVYFPGV